MRRRGCGCAATGCAIPLVCLLIIFGAVGILTGNWAALAALKVPAVPPAVADIPADYLVLYRDAAARFGLDWPVLAAVGRVETNHGRNRNGCDPNYAGGCVPPAPPDLDCADIRALGIAPVRSIGSDPHRLDGDRDGFGCE